MTFTLPWETFVAQGEERVRRAWEIGAPKASELWSMPSSHTAAAAMLAVFLARMYPKLMPLAVGLAGMVGAARVILWAHYPSDVVTGGAVGAAIGMMAHDMRWGARLVPRAWKDG
jgi:membrane-associated phospholipid phosphatase